MWHRLKPPDMSSRLFKDKSKPILSRCQKDLNTKLRLKYQPFYKTVDSRDGVHVEVDGKKMIMMTSNEYLGFSHHPEVKKAAQRAIDQWGTSPCGSRLSNGSMKYHSELEEALAQFLGKEACHVFVAGYLACVGSIAGLAQRDDIVIADKSIHSSLWDGAILARSKIERFDHEDVQSLEAVLKELPEENAKIIVMDGVCSMEGHVAPLPKITKLSQEYDSFLILDDAHGIGVLGENGRGTADSFNLSDKVDLIVGTFSKALVSTGGFIAGDKSVVEYLRTNCRQIIFSAALGSAAAASTLTSLKLLQKEPDHLERLWENTRYYHRILKDLGLDCWNSTTPATPIVIGEKERCYFFWKSLWDQGYFTVMSIAPGVPAGKDMIRTAVTSDFTKELMDRFGDALKVAMKKSGISSKP
jgi:8-amino-7-oxononanoate synthase